MKEINPFARYSKNMEWVRVEGDIATIGLSDFGQKAAGEITLLEFIYPTPLLFQNDIFAVVESNKTATEIACPIRGEIVEVNTMLLHNPSLINHFPYSKAWLIRLKLREKGKQQFIQLMTAQEFENYIGVFFNKK